ncbi:MAG TPA: mechanosensitive ion channel [Sphingorhabdus sp.]|jgi:small-conductance mechanosensitive channel|uniref:mechanosensitive ion channel family protein n=1 Tax=Sphingorhabdus sp. TaxID=1902408 RepID=UPI002B596E5A|nr:mechanosensitive ion channel domain-containing protein [Sphingorhabdus sp.]HMT41993.1 mechanosensitive ion channel [Sphingorhabdus sp.]HMU22957.1 mechanosensitive ion channel [Sphingorhabdus sp.]
MTTPLPKIPDDPIAAINARMTQYAEIVTDWVRGNIAELSVAVIAATLVYVVLSWLKRRAAKIARDSEDRSAMTSIIARTLARTGKFFRIMVAVELVNGYANAPEQLARTIDVLFTIAVVLQVAIWLREIVIGLIERRANESGSEHETLQSAMVLIRLLVSFAVFAIAAIVILDNLGVNVTGLVAGLGVGGIAIGLAAQGIFSDLFAAMSIIFDRPFKRGDTITYDTTTARVERIGMKSTRLRALTGEEKIISNAKLLEKEITDNTKSVYRRVNFLISLVYQTPVEDAQRVPVLLREIVEAQGAEFIRGGFHTFAPSSLDFQLVFDVQSEDLDEVFHVRHAVGLNIVQRFVDEGIHFAYPTQTTFTAGPDGTLVMPYAERLHTAPAPNKKA